MYYHKSMGVTLIMLVSYLLLMRKCKEVIINLYITYNNNKLLMGYNQE